MTEFKIEKGLALPPRKGSRYPFREMCRSDDSFFVPCPDEEKISTQNRLSGAQRQRQRSAVSASSLFARSKAASECWRTE